MSKDKRTPTQKIEDLERALLGVGEAVNRMAKEVRVNQEGLKLIGQKVNAMIRAAERGLTVTADNVMAMMTEITIEEMQETVKNMLANGVIYPSEAITENSFVVGRDLDREDTSVVANPRLQFSMAGVPEALRSKLVGAKVGAQLTITEGNNILEVQEIYEIGRPAEATTPALEASEATTDEEVVNG